MSLTRRLTSETMPDTEEYDSDDRGIINKNAHRSNLAHRHRRHGVLLKYGTGDLVSGGSSGDAADLSADPAGSDMPTGIFGR